MSKAEGLKKITNGYYLATALKPSKELKTRNEDYIAAGTVNWVSQVAFEPLMVCLSVEVDSHLNETIDYSGKFTLHVLSDKQIDLIEKFANNSEITEKSINGVAYEKSGDRLILKETIAFIECKLKNSVRCGDHTVHFGEVVNSGVNENIAPLSTVAVPSAYQGQAAK